MAESITGKKDLYCGLTISSECMKDISASEFTKMLPALLQKWKSERVRGLWFKLLKPEARFVPVLAENGFDYHHANKNYVMMTKFIPEEAVNPLPPYAFTQIGVGGIVVDDEGRFLLMKEKRGFYLGWKFPGGLVDPGETIFRAAEREVFEETAVETEGLSILAFRHALNIKFEILCDIYFLVVLKCKEGGNRIPKPCAHEAADARWFTRKEMLEMPETSSPLVHPFFKTIVDQYDHWNSNGRKGIYTAHSTLRGKRVTEYYTQHIVKEEEIVSLL